MSSRQAQPGGAGSSSHTPSWRSVHIYYHAPGKEDLLLDAVRPLFGLVDDDVQGAYFTRHWRQGPHLRLNFLTSATAWDATVRPAVETVVGGFLRAHPSTERLDEQAELPKHQFLAELERDTGPLQPWYPDNSIQYMPYESRSHAVGSQAAADLLTRFHVSATGLAFRMLDAIRAGEDRVDLATGLMLATSHTMLPPLTASFVAYRAHAEGFLANCAEPGRTRSMFGQLYRDRKDALADRLAAVLTSLDGDPPEPARFVREWAALVREYGRRAGPLIASGALYGLPRAGGPMARGLRISELHELMTSSPGYHASLYQSPRFLPYRLTLNCTYLFLGRLGVTPVQRFTACHLTANTVEDVYGVSAVDLLREVIGRQRETRRGATT